MNYKWNKTFVVFLSFLVLIFLVSCEMNNPKKRLNCICLIDYSGSLSDETLNKYIHIISNEIFQNLGEKDRLIVLPIDEGAKKEAIKIVYEDMCEHKFSFHTDGFTHAQDSIFKRIHDYTIKTSYYIQDEIVKQKELRRQYTYYTDIFSALEQCHPLIESNNSDNIWQSINRFIIGKRKVVTDNLIVIFSDMIHESQEFNFNNSLGCSSTEAQEILNILKTKNRIPNLSNCLVFVDGRTGKNNIQIENVKNFWVEYFKCSNAELKYYDFDCGTELNSYLNKRKTLFY
jgi:hypothetical protein